MIPGGFFIDRFGARTALTVVGVGSALFGTLTGVTGFVFAGTAQIWLSLVVVRGLMGLFTTPLHPACARAVADWTPLSGRSLVNGLVTGAALLGIASTYRIFGALVARIDWTNAFVVTGAVTALLTGTDLPNLPRSNLTRAIDLLKTHDLALGPTLDGGYYLIGLRRPIPELFEGIAWSTPAVLRETKKKAEEAGLSVGVLPECRDLDDLQDLKAFIHMLGQDRNISKRTEGALRLIAGRLKDRNA